MNSQKLLQKELYQYLELYKTPLSLIKYNKHTIPKLFYKYKYYGMTEHSFCCYGLEQSCWCEVVEEGVWDLTYENVKNNIQSRIKDVKKYLYKEPRFYMCEDNSGCNIYIYVRDVYGMDLHIWFSNEER